MSAASVEWIPDAIRGRLEEAETCFSRAEALVAAAETPRELVSILANRGMVRSLLGRYDDARRDCERALDIDPSLSIVKSNLGRVLLIQDKFEEAARILESIPSGDAPADVAPLLANVHIELGNPTTACRILAPLENSADRPDHVLILGLLLLVHEKLGNASDVERIFNALKARKNDPEASRTAAAHCARNANSDEAIALLRRAIEECGDSPSSRYHLVLADILYRAKRFEEAVVEYDQVHIPTGRSRECVRFVSALFRAGHQNRALKVVQGVRGGGPPVAEFSEIEALIQEHLGDLESANRLRKEMLAASILPEHQKIRLAINYLRRNNRSRAAELTLEVGVDAVSNDPELLKGSAELRTALELPGALEFAYQLIEKCPNDPGAHLFYINSFFRRERLDEAQFHPAMAGVDTVVRLCRHGANVRQITIISGETDASRDHLAVTHPFAAQILGKTVGESFSFPAEGPGKTEYHIESVQSKFVAAFQDCIDRFNERFPTAYGLMRVDVSPNDPTEIVLMLDRRRTYGDQVLNLYRAGLAPACTVARLLGKSAAEFFRSLILDQQINVLSFDGTPNGLQLETAALAATRPVLLEVSAIITMHSLGVLNSLIDWLPEVLVTQQTLDSISKILLDLYPEKEGGRIFSDSPGHICLVARSADEAAKTREFYTTLLDFLHSKCKIVAHAPSEEFEGDEVQKVLGGVALSALAAVKSSGTLLVSDDLGLRRVAHNSHGVSSVGTLSVLRRLRDSGHLSYENYHQAVQWLVQHQFVFVSVDKADIIWVLQRNQWRPTDEVAVAFDTLSGPDCDINGATRITLEVLREIWNEPLYRETAQLLSDLLLRALVTGRNAAQAVALLATLHHSSTQLWTPASQQIHNVIQTWRPQPRRI